MTTLAPWFRRMGWPMYLSALMQAQTDRCQAFIPSTKIKCRMPFFIGIHLTCDRCGAPLPTTTEGL